jgi:hypothetical protein
MRRLPEALVDTHQLKMQRSATTSDRRLGAATLAFESVKGCDLGSWRQEL